MWECPDAVGFVRSACPIGPIGLGCICEPALRRSLMDARALPPLPELLALLARAPDGVSGVAAVVRCLGVAYGAHRVALEFVDRTKAPLVWRDPVRGDIPPVPGLRPRGH